MKYLVDLIKSGRYINIFYAKTCATPKISTVVGYHVVLAMLLLFECIKHEGFVKFIKIECCEVFFVSTEYKNLNGREVRIENSVLRVTVRHHEACRVMPSIYPE